MKKALSLALALSTTLGLMTGCGSSSSSSTTSTEASAETSASASAGETVITFGIHVANPESQEPVTWQIVQAFNEANAGKYKVEFQAADTETHTTNMKLQAADGTLPEIFWMDASQAPEYAEAGYLLDLSDFLSQNEAVDTALGGMEDAFNNGSTQYGLPYQCNVQGFFYNKDVFDAAQVAYPTEDTTYDEFLTMIDQLKAAGTTPIAIGSKNSSYAMWEFNEFLARYGWDEDIDACNAGETPFNNEKLVSCFEKVKGLADAGAFPENMATIEYFDAKQLFLDGSAAMFGTGQWDCAAFDEALGDKIGFWWGPKFEDSDTEQNIAMKVPSAPIMVSSEVADDPAIQEAVYAFLAYYYSEEAAGISYEGSIFPATNYSGVAASETQYAMNQMIDALASGWAVPEAAPDQTLTPSVQEALYDGLFGVMQGVYTPEQALDNMDSALAY